MKMMNKCLHCTDESCEIGVYQDCDGLDKSCRHYSVYLGAEGYHKTIWHKVADGDLPEYGKRVLCISAKKKLQTVGFISKNIIDDTVWDVECDDEEYWDLDKIVAWTELPEYKEDTDDE